MSASDPTSLSLVSTAMASPNSTKLPFQNRTVSDCFVPRVILSYAAVWSALLLPLYFLVLRVGFQRWRRNERSPVSHTDFFTYHLSSFEFLMFCGYLVLSYGSFRSDYLLLERGGRLMLLASPGSLCFHVLTCIERYLAVVHPVVYMSLRRERWTRARPLMVVGVWAAACLWWGVLRVWKQYNVATLCSMGTVIVIVTFCSVQVLRALRNPSPGEGRGAGRSKRKAFFTILAILAALMVWFVGGSVIFGILDSVLEEEEMCLFRSYGLWCQLPNSLVLPLLFLHRAGKLPQCRGKGAEVPHLQLRG